MKLSTLFLLATACLAADNSSTSAPNNKQPQPLGIRGYAIAIGNALGTSTEMVIKKTFDEKRFSLFVSTKELEQVVLRNKESKEDFRPFNPFAELFNGKCLLENLSVSQTVMNIKQTQSLFLKCSRIPEAKTAIDVAILKWLSGGIKDVKSSAGGGMLYVEPDILDSLCALSLDPDDKTFNFTKDIQTVLTQVQELIAREWFTPMNMENTLPTMLTVMKIFDEGSNRTMAKEITSTFLNEDFQRTGPIFMLTFGVDDELIKSSETPLVARWSEQLDVQSALKRKVHSLAILPFLNPASYFIIAFDSPCLKADISTEGTLGWESKEASRKDRIDVDNRRNVKLDGTQLLIIFKIDPPAYLCEEITSCASLTIFYELLEKRSMKQMILSYGMTILETAN